MPLVQRCSNYQWCLSLKHHLVAKRGMAHRFSLYLWLSLSLWFVVVLQLFLFCFFLHVMVVVLSHTHVVLLNFVVCYRTFCLQEATKAMAWAWWWRSFAASWPELSTAKKSAPGRSPTGSPIWWVAASWFLKQDLWQTVKWRRVEYYFEIKKNLFLNYFTLKVAMCCVELSCVCSQGQCFVAIDPNSFASGFNDRMSDLLAIHRGMEPVSGCCIVS